MNPKLSTEELLVRDKIITNEQLEKSFLQAKDNNEKIGNILVNNGYVDKKTYLKYSALYLQIPFIDLTQYALKREITIKLPESYARHCAAILLEEDAESMLIGMADPGDIFATDELSRVLHKKLKLALVDAKTLPRILDLTYRRTSEITNFAEKLDTELKEAVELGEEDALKQTDTAVEKLINSLFADAVQIGASDVHIEPGDNILRIRFRVDGFLQEQIISSKEQHIASAISQRLKLMSGLNIAEKRLPQDGGLSIMVHDVPLDVRLSTMPVQYGESIVMRLLRRASQKMDLSNTGMPDDMLARFRQLIKMPHGIILVTGPTGSGKTTTLYGALSEINEVGKNLITVEDPVEYRLERVNQVQVNEQLGLTFARVLKSILRQDPNIILVGEIRDNETASIALRSALTGQLVLSTLHTNDAASTAIRLIDIGIESYLVAATVRAILAQRLARRICKNCKIKHTLTPEETLFIKNFAPPETINTEFYVGEGCSHCNRSGYQGRTGIFELLEIDEEMMEALRRNNTNEFVAIAEKSRKWPTLLQSALTLAIQGVTTISEALRLAGEKS